MTNSDQFNWAGEFAPRQATAPDVTFDQWATSKSGRARIRCHDRGADWPTAATRYDVYALDGHELLPRTRSFTTETEARAYANTLWAAL